MTPAPAFWRGKRVLLTGHTGFKGSWLASWLLGLGAEVRGFALPPDGSHALYNDLKLDHHLDSVWADIGCYTPISALIKTFRPEIVFHLAAQALVRASYTSPLETFRTNLMGTVNLLEAARQFPGNIQAVVVVTSDKCYEQSAVANSMAFREDDPMGGHDPYSASKGCAELATRSFQRSLFAAGGVGVATARAGNVLGGGDWAPDRIVPDLMRAWLSGQTLRVRNPSAIRPWQHVLDPLAGYLLLAERLSGGEPLFRKGWNFGPNEVYSVGELLARAQICWGGGAWIAQPAADPLHEAAVLRLDATAAQRDLGWRPVWGLDEALAYTLSWYRDHAAGAAMSAPTERQIQLYQAQSDRASASAPTRREKQ